MRIWDDYWLYITQPVRPYGPPTELTKNWTVFELISNRTNDWDQEKVRKILPEMADHIFTIKPSKCGAPDKRVLLGTDSGTYATKFGYHFGKRGHKLDSRNLVSKNSTKNPIAPIENLLRGNPYWRNF